MLTRRTRQRRPTAMPSRGRLSVPGTSTSSHKQFACHPFQPSWPFAGRRQSGFADYRIRRPALLALAGRRQSGFSWTFTMRTTVSFVLCSQLEPTPTRTARCYLRSTTSSYERSITLSFDYFRIEYTADRYIISHLIVSHVSPTEILVDLDTASGTSLIFPSRNTVLFIDISPPV